LFKRFAKNKRGVGTVVGAVFFVLVLLGGFSTIIWEITEYDNYMQVVNDRDQLDWEKQNEIIEITGVCITGDSLNISVLNNGAVVAHLVNLWVTEYVDEVTANWHEAFQIDYYVNSGSTIVGIGQDIETLEVDSQFTYTVKIVTERGNVAMGTSEVEESPPPSPRYFGVFSLDWFYFRYSSLTHPEPTFAGSLEKTDDYVAFYVKVINNHDEAITILSPSLLMLLVEYQEPHLNLVQDVDYGGDWITDWDRTTDYRHTGYYSMRADSDSTYLTSYDLDASDATDITVSFWYRDYGIDDSDDAYLQFWNGATYMDIFELGNTSPENTWHYYTVTTSDPQYLISDFNIRIDATSLDSSYYGSEYLWIDDVLIKKTVGAGEVTLLDDGFESSMSPTITAYDDDDPVTVGPYQTEILIFAAEDALSDDWAWETEMPYYVHGTEGAIVMIALVFTMESDPAQMYAQSLPFEALVLLD
jgi:hypothetical protein